MSLSNYCERCSTWFDDGERCDCRPRLPSARAPLSNFGRVALNAAVFAGAEPAPTTPKQRHRIAARALRIASHLDRDPVRH